MKKSTAVHDQIVAALNAAGVTVKYGPVNKADVPLTAGGSVAQFAVLWPTAGLHQYTRSSGTRSGREDRVSVVCIGSTARDALAVADKVEAAVGGLVVSPGGSPLRQTISTPPATEPHADPIRVSLAVEYTTITKG